MLWAEWRGVSGASWAEESWAVKRGERLHSDPFFLVNWSRKFAAIKLVDTFLWWRLHQCQLEIKPYGYVVDDPCKVAWYLLGGIFNNSAIKMKLCYFWGSNIKVKGYSSQAWGCRVVSSSQVWPKCFSEQPRLKIVSILTLQDGSLKTWLRDDESDAHRARVNIGDLQMAWRKSHCHMNR